MGFFSLPHYDHSNPDQHSQWVYLQKQWLVHKGVDGDPVGKGPARSRTHSGLLNPDQHSQGVYLH